MASWGLDNRWGSKGSGAAVVMITVVGPSARAVSSTPSKILGLGLACAAAVNEATTSAGVMADPSWNCTPSRRVKRHEVSSICCHPVASDGPASPRSSSSTRVSAVFQRESLKASSLRGDKPERGGWSMASLIRSSPFPLSAAWLVPAKHPVKLVASRRVESVARHVLDRLSGTLITCSAD
jgi:hypothetical protein